VNPAGGPAVPFPPVEPTATSWELHRLAAEAGEDLVAAGADLAPGTVLAAYRCGLFPMGLGRHGRGPVGWWSPDPRGILLPAEFRLRKSLRQVLPRFEVRVDTAFEAVVAQCADPRREGRWITPEISRAYLELHRGGWAHSVEAWQDGELVGGLYGVAVGGLFAGESMFHAVRDASKVALAGLVRLLAADADDRRLIDVQWRTDHLARLGVREVPREDYLERLERALQAPAVDFSAG
jgi:leucyl/phenylalanyl-tRNA--protein transferase